MRATVIRLVSVTLTTDVDETAFACTRASGWNRLAAA